jgi:hypothetical protein
MDTKVKAWFFLCLIGSHGGESALQAQLAVGAEIQRDRFTYHFDNPSSADTPFLVPHFFEQHYVADNVWLTGAARYAAGIRWETAAGVTPQRTSTGDDYDTFFNPDGTVIVSGTTGGISIRSFRISQRAELARVGPVTLVAGYRLRVDRSDFQLGHKTVTRNNVIVTAIDVATRELTSSQVHEVLVGARLMRAVTPAWTLSIDGEVAPTTVGRLLVQLPDKYPGEDLVFLAKVAATTGRVALARRTRRWTVEVSVDAGKTWSYRSEATLARQTLGARFHAGRVW